MKLCFATFGVIPRYDGSVERFNDKTIYSIKKFIQKLNEFS